VFGQGGRTGFTPVLPLKTKFALFFPPLFFFFFEILVDAIPLSLSGALSRFTYQDRHAFWWFHIECSLQLLYEGNFSIDWTVSAATRLFLASEPFLWLFVYEFPPHRLSPLSPFTALRKVLCRPQFPHTPTLFGRLNPGRNSPHAACTQLCFSFEDFFDQPFLFHCSLYLT